MVLAFTLPAKLLAGLNAGMLWAGIVIVVFFEMLRATFSALFLTMKLPKPLRYTFLLAVSESLMLYMKDSTICCTCAFSTPVLFAISLTMSALVIITSIFSLTYFQNSRWSAKIHLIFDSNDKNNFFFGFPSALTLSVLFRFYTLRFRKNQPKNHGRPDFRL